MTDLGIEHPGRGGGDGQGVSGLGSELLADTLYGALEIGGHGYLDLVGLHGTDVQRTGADPGNDNG